MSDMHGNIEATRQALENVDLSPETGRDNMLVFLGDFIDGASDSLEVLRLVKRLCDEHPGRVVAIKGNHEERMAGWLDGREAGPAWLGSPKTDATLRSLLAPEQYEQVMETLVHGRSAQEMQDIRTDDPAYRVACDLARSYLRDNHAELVEWLVGLPYHFETERQIFVHAGVQEAAGTRWEQRTPAMWFANKYPPSRGHFYKDVVAGHISTAQIAKDPLFHSVYWDGASHYYIDGAVHLSHVVPVLKYDVDSGEYTSFWRVFDTAARAGAGRAEGLVAPASADTGPADAASASSASPDGDQPHPDWHWEEQSVARAMERWSHRSRRRYAVTRA